MDIAKIYEGWRNKLIPPKDLKELIQKVAQERMIICNKCEHHSKHHNSFRPDNHCVICGCTLSAKTACLSCSCPIYRWREVMNSEQEEEIKQAHEEEDRDKEDSSRNSH